MKDLHPVRFHVAASGAGGAQKYVAACPITGSDIAAGNVPSFVIVRAAREDPGKEKKNNDVDDDGEDEAARNPNVLSERAIQEMGVAGLQAEYGPFEERDLIRLAPPTTGGVLEEIRRSWEVRMEEEHIAKVSVDTVTHGGARPTIFTTSTLHAFRIICHSSRRRKTRSGKANEEEAMSTQPRRGDQAQLAPPPEGGATARRRRGRWRQRMRRAPPSGPL
jgi:hypothetical protein